jgi:regulatory protein
MENEITILSLEKKKTQYLVKTTEGDYLFHEDVILRYYIFKDKVFPISEFKKLLLDQDMTTNFQKAIRYLKYGPRSEAEIREHLGDIQGWVTIKKRLSALGYIDDERFAKTMMDYYIRSQKGPAYIRQMLIQKKIGKSIIDQTLQTYTDEIETDVIRHLLVKEQLLHDKEPIAKQKQLILSKLIRLGFSSGPINHCVKEMTFVNNSGPKLKSDYEKLHSKYTKANLNPTECNKKIIQALLIKGYDYQNIRQVMKIDHDFE